MSKKDKRENPYDPIIERPEDTSKIYIEDSNNLMKVISQNIFESYEKKIEEHCRRKYGYYDFQSAHELFNKKIGLIRRAFYKGFYGKEKEDVNKEYMHTKVIGLEHARIYREGFRELDRLVRESILEDSDRKLHFDHFIRLGEQAGMNAREMFERESKKENKKLKANPWEDLEAAKAIARVNRVKTTEQKKINKLKEKQFLFEKRVRESFRKFIDIPLNVNLENYQILKNTISNQLEGFPNHRRILTVDVVLAKLNMNIYTSKEKNITPWEFHNWMKKFHKKITINDFHTIFDGYHMAIQLSGMELLIHLIGAMQKEDISEDRLAELINVAGVTAFKEFMWQQTTYRKKSGIISIPKTDLEKVANTAAYKDSNPVINKEGQTKLY